MEKDLKIDFKYSFCCSLKILHDFLFLNNHSVLETLEKDFQRKRFFILNINSVIDTFEDNPE